MKRRKYRFNFIDALLILLLLVAVAVVVYVFIIGNNAANEGEVHQVEYVVEVTGINKSFADSVKEGDSVYSEKDRSMPIGTVSAPPETRASLKAAYSNASGEEVYTEQPDLIDMVITFTGSATLDDNGYGIRGTYILVNGTTDLIFGDMSCSACCISMNILD